MQARPIAKQQFSFSFFHFSSFFSDFKTSTEIICQFFYEKNSITCDTLGLLKTAMISAWKSLQWLGNLKKIIKNLIKCNTPHFVPGSAGNLGEKNIKVLPNSSSMMSMSICLLKVDEYICTPNIQVWLNFTHRATPEWSYPSSNCMSLQIAKGILWCFSVL